MQQYFPIFTATPHGILVNGLPLAKSFSKDITPQARRYVALAEELLKQIKPEDWDNRTPHDLQNIPTLTKAKLLLALASPQPMEMFHKYREDQARVPAGNPGGGQWTDEGGSASGSGSADGKQTTQQKLQAGIKTRYGKVMPVKTNIGPNGKGTNQVNIFIGGAGDQDDNHIVLNSGSLQSATGNNYYFTWKPEGAIDDFISKLPPDVQINLIGHSYGGDTAADVAIANSGKVNTLITIDPVSRFKPDFSDVKSSVGTWVNVYATAKSGGTTGGDAAAFFGGSWGDSPNSYATIHLTSDAHHEGFDTMLQNTSYAGSNSAYTGKTPYQILNGQ